MHGCACAQGVNLKICSFVQCGERAYERVECERRVYLNTCCTHIRCGLYIEFPWCSGKVEQGARALPFDDCFRLAGVFFFFSGAVTGGFRSIKVISRQGSDA